MKKLLLTLCLVVGGLFSAASAQAQAGYDMVGDGAPDGLYYVGTTVWVSGRPDTTFLIGYNLETGNAEYFQVYDNTTNTTKSTVTSPDGGPVLVNGSPDVGNQIDAAVNAGGKGDSNSGSKGDENNGYSS